jgi:hypothetical protein
MAERGLMAGSWMILVAYAGQFGIWLQSGYRVFHYFFLPAASGVVGGVFCCLPYGVGLFLDLLLVYLRCLTGWLPAVLVFPCIRIGLLAVPWLVACGFGLSLHSYWSVGGASLAGCLRFWPFLAFILVY